ncbi:hypothetical protein SYNPS1DRAFT_20925 [Syncephalis pseudoplumigaleata]|uniref:Uncharacterized protein n=1 Tax=Syncephalis pseudoplumigaleata TaxID=1712513 RepID=A0A4P9Z6T5_9FUNG|nr:hypothetical protein SYNPS1DRAFT_20925 [Syncephalis pseudoplumigaleata]|eukprot:RKP27581.1 hypothetical protein SYNPS1DRAFT_20925 [Syncephalis pseudoplumigaleata]
MVQGLVKKANANKAKQAQAKKPGSARKGARVIAPKNTTLIKQKLLQKKLSANINRNIETQMATRAGAVGKLTIMRSSMDASKKGGKGKNKVAKKK